MKKKFKLGIIGAGFMSNAIVKGAIASSILEPCEIFVADITQSALDKMKVNGVNVSLNAQEVANNSEFLLFAVKPQNINEVLNSIKGCSCSKFISIMAGVRKEKIKSVLGNVCVARCMPNTPCAIGFGAVGLDLSDFIDQNDVCFIKNLLSAFAEVVEVSEDKMGAVTGISGSSPAYFYLFLKGIIESGVKHGLTYKEALKLATNSMIGAGEMVLASKDKTLDDLITAVCSKGGTTIEAINVYNSENLSQITERAIDACVKRSKELEDI